MAGKSTVEVFYTKQCEAIAESLKKAGFLTEVRTFKESGKPYKSLSLEIAKDSFGMKLTDVKRVSRPGRRIYRGVSEIQTFSKDAIMSVVSTSRGIMSGSEAKKKKLGGEVICIVR